MTDSVKLTLSSGEEINNPTDGDIRKAMGTLNIARDGEGFAILAWNEMTYLQVSGDKDIGFDMEYQEGSLDKHYRADRENFTMDEVAQALGQYRDQSIDWNQYGNWSRITW